MGLAAAGEHGRKYSPPWLCNKNGGMFTTTTKEDYYKKPGNPNANEDSLKYKPDKTCVSASLAASLHRSSPLVANAGALD